MKKKIFDTAKDAVLHATYRGITRQALQILYKGLCLFSKKETELRRLEKERDGK